MISRFVLKSLITRIIKLHKKNMQHEVNIDGNEYWSDAEHNLSLRSINYFCLSYKHTQYWARHNQRCLYCIQCRHNILVDRA